MYLPEYLFFDAKKLNVQHTTQFTGNLDVPVALESNPRCWIKEDIAGNKQKKTIVLSDFGFGSLTGNDPEQIKHFIDGLLAEGFSIYLWQEGGPIELNEKSSGFFLLEFMRQRCT